MNLGINSAGRLFISFTSISGTATQTMTTTYVVNYDTWYVVGWAVGNNYRISTGWAPSHMIILTW